jgi:hypothetical protein
MLASESTFQAARLGKVDVDDAAATVAAEMMMRLPIAVVSRRPRRRQNLVEIAVRDQNFEVSVNGAQR